MQCHQCGAEVQIQQGFCPRCGTFIGMPGGAPPAQQSRTLWIVAVCFVVLFVMVPLGLGFFLWRSGIFKKPSYPVALPQAQVPVEDLEIEHGAVLKSSQLHGHGKVYFVPLGPQAIPPQSLAAHYKQKFNLFITVLPAIPIDPTAWNVSRKQYNAEQLIASVLDAYPKLASDEHAVLIGLTDIDLYAESLDWEFTTSYRSSGRFGIVSSKRFDPFWGDARNSARQKTRMVQMLTKYIALLYYGLHENNDPRSILRQPLNPDGGPDDLYESDLHPEQTPLGLPGNCPVCMLWVYSYKTGRLRTVTESVQECANLPVPKDPDEEWFVADFRSGQLSERKVDFGLASVPAIRFERAYLSQYPQPFALGIGTNHSYDSWLNSDHPSTLSDSCVIYPDGTCRRFVRTSPGSGFSPSIVLEDKTLEDFPFYHARMTWNNPHFEIRLPNGEMYSFLGCGAHSRCFFDGYRDSRGNQLTFQRDKAQNLMKLTPTHGPGLEFQYDGQNHITQIRDSSGHISHYEYDARGGLARVISSAGKFTAYSYDAGHHMTAIGIAPRAGMAPRTILTSSYDDQGRIAKITLTDGRVFTVQRDAANKKIEIVDSAGSKTVIVEEGKDNDEEDGEYTLWTRPLNPQTASR